MPESVFLLMDRAKSAARAQGKRVIDLSIGASDLPVPGELIAELESAARDPATWGYCLKSCTMRFLEEATRWYAGRFGLELDPSTQALSLIGSQEGLAHLLLAVADPGDAVLIPEVAYPSYWGAAALAGLEAVPLKLGEDLLPVFEELDPGVLERARVIVLNYPNNPTAALADRAFWARALAFAEAHDLLIVHDNPYIDMVYEGEAVSPLVLEGALERTVELFSFSKSFHMGGFRLGFALGNAEAIAALEAAKAPVDFNQYLGIQRMGIAALRLPPTGCCATCRSSAAAATPWWRPCRAAVCRSAAPRRACTSGSSCPRAWTTCASPCARSSTPGWRWRRAAASAPAGTVTSASPWCSRPRCSPRPDAASRPCSTSPAPRGRGAGAGLGAPAPGRIRSCDDGSAAAAPACASVTSGASSRSCGNSRSPW